MQRINLSVDLEDNKVFMAGIDKAIEGVVKSKSRDFLEKTVNEEVERIIKNRMNHWFSSSSYMSGNNKIDEVIKARVDRKIEEAIGKIQITPADIKNSIDVKLKSVSSLIDESIERRIDGIGIEKYISNIVEREVAKLVPAKLLEMFTLTFNTGKGE